MINTYTYTDQNQRSIQPFLHSPNELKCDFDDSDESLPGLIDSSESESDSEPSGAASVVDSDDEWIQQLGSTGEPPHSQLEHDKRNKPPSTPTSECDSETEPNKQIISQSPPKTPRKYVCVNCGEEGHTKKRCLVHVVEEDRVHIDEIVRQAQRARRAELRQIPENKRKDREYEQSNSRKEAQKLRRSSDEYKAKQKQIRESEEYRAKQQQRNERRKTAKDLLRLRADNIVTNSQYPDALAAEADIARIDAEYEFSQFKRKDKDVFLDACLRMSYDYTTNNCCVVCECDWPKALTGFYSLDDTFLPKLRLRVSMTEEKKKIMPLSVQEDYCLGKYDKRLDGLILSRYGLYTPNCTPIDLDDPNAVEDLRLCLCNECADVIVKGNSEGRRSSTVSNATAVHVSAVIAAGNKRTRKQKERRECTMSDDGNLSTSDDSDDDATMAVSISKGTDSEVMDGVQGSEGTVVTTGSSSGLVDGTPLSSPINTVDIGVATIAMNCEKSVDLCLPDAVSVASAVDSESGSAVIAQTEPAGATTSTATATATTAEPSAQAQAPVHLKPPMNAIANGNWIGYLPSIFWSISRTEEQAVALMHVNIYLTTVIGSGHGNKMLNSHHFVLKHPSPFIRYFSHDVTGCVRFTIVGANVSEALAMLRQRYPLNVDLAHAFAKWLDESNINYRLTSHDITKDLEEVLQHENFIVDRSENSDDKVSAKLVRLMQFGITSEKSGEQSAAEVADTLLPAREPRPVQTGSKSDEVFVEDVESDEDSEDEIEENTRATMIFQPDMVTATHPLGPDEAAPQLRSITDIIAFNSSTIPKKRGLGCLTYAYPTLFPYGCGGFDERREVKMSERQWSLRFLRLHGVAPGRRNSQHYGALATIFDQIAMVRAFRAQNVSMRVKEEAITQFGLWKKEDVNDLLAYKEEVEELARRGLKPGAPPEKIKALLSMIDMIKPGMSSMYGSDASRGSARHIAFGLQIRMGNTHFYSTHCPDPNGNYVIAINTSNMRDPKHVDFAINLNDVLPSRKSRKKIAAMDPFQCAVFAKHVNDMYIEYFLGWSLEFKGPKKEGGVMGLLRYYHQGAETQENSVLHFHGCGGVYGLPRTSAEMTAALADSEFLQRYTAYIDSIASPVPFLADSGPSLNACPVPGCTGTLESLPFPGEAYCRRRPDQAPVDTSHCATCSKRFKHTDVLLQRIQAFADQHNIKTDPHLVDAYLCNPAELTEDGDLTPRDLVYMALGLLRFQNHYETHAKSCFKITSRTPSGHLCRYLFPKLARHLQTLIDIANGKVVSHRPIGCEYYNLCCLVWTRLSKNNTDIQFLINGSTRRSTSYTTKYSFKAQRPETALAMKVGLLGKAYKNSLNAADADDISPLEQGRRTINKALYQFTQPQELHLTMAAYMLLNDGPFFFTHAPVFINLKHLCACFYDAPPEVYEDLDPDEQYLDTDDDGSETAEEGDPDSEEDVQQPEDSEEMEATTEQNEPDEDVENDDRTGYVTITLSKYALLNRPDSEGDGAAKRHRVPRGHTTDDFANEPSAPAADREDRHEADDYIDDLCLLTDYWHRPTSIWQFYSLIRNTA